MSATILWTDGIITHRPPVIRSFLRELASSPMMTGIPESAQRVMFFLASLIDKDGANPHVFPSKTTIAEVTGLSEISVYRALSRLDKDGLISRESQTLTGSGFNTKFGISPIRIGEPVLGIFNDSVKSSDSGKHGLSEAPREPIVDATSDTEGSPSITMTDVYRNTAVEPEESKEAVGQHRIPQDLAWLTGHGMTTANIVHLMAIAKRFGHRLQDVVAARIETIRAGTIRNLWGWLAHLLRCQDVDYAWMARSRETETAEKRQVEARRRNVDNIAMDLAGRTLVDQDGTRYEVTGSGQFCYVMSPNDRQARCAPVGMLVDVLARLSGFPRLQNTSKA